MTFFPIYQQFQKNQITCEKCTWRFLKVSPWTIFHAFKDISKFVSIFRIEMFMCNFVYFSREKKPWLRIPGSPILYSAAAWTAKKDQAVFNWLYRFWQKVPAFGVGLNSLVNSSWASPIKKYPIIDSSVFEKPMPTR